MNDTLDIVKAILDAPARLESITSYTPYIAMRIKDALSANDSEGIVKSVGRVQYDLHEVGGYYLSTNKTVEVTDRNGNRYRVTVEDVRDYNAAPLTAREREIIRSALEQYAVKFGDEPGDTALAVRRRFEERR